MCAKLISLTSKYSSSTKLRLNYIYICALYVKVSNLLSQPDHGITKLLLWTILSP